MNFWVTLFNLVHLSPSTIHYSQSYFCTWVLHVVPFPLVHLAIGIYSMKGSLDTISLDVCFLHHLGISSLVLFKLQDQI